MASKLRLYSRELSSCCNARQLIVRSREGGFVTKNCCVCEEPRYVSLQELPLLQCEACGAPIKTGVRFGNYYCKCTLCGDDFELYTRLPWWHEHFDHHGIATPDEYCSEFSY
jgi:hypothetical protein